MIPQELMARHLIEALDGKAAALSPAQMMRSAQSSGQPMHLFRVAVNNMHQLAVIKPASFNDAVLLTVKGERMADSFRGLSADQTRQLERDAALRIMQGVSLGQHPQHIKTAHIGPSRLNGILGSLVEHKYVKHMHFGPAYRLTDHGVAAMQNFSLSA